MIGALLLDKGFIKSVDEIGDISQSGGGIDREKLKEIINTPPAHKLLIIKKRSIKNGGLALSKK